MSSKENRMLFLFLMVVINVFGLIAGIYIGTATDECIRGLIVMYYWYKKKWFGKSVVDKSTSIIQEEESPG